MWREFESHPVIMRLLVVFYNNFITVRIRMKEQIKEALASVHLMLDVMLEDDKMFTNVAKIMCKMYLALIAEGFTEDQAARIVANYKVTSVN